MEDFQLYEVRLEEPSNLGGRKWEENELATITGVDILKTGYSHIQVLSQEKEQNVHPHTVT
jgi:hypothetical protein